MTFIIILLYSFLAGFLGTLVMTLVQVAEIHLTGRSISCTPAIVAFRILRLNFETLRERQKIAWSYAVHFLYGTFWGFPLAFLYMFDISVMAMYAIYFFVIWVQGLLVFYIIGDSPLKWGVIGNLKEVVFKLIYSSSVFIFGMLISQY